MTESKPYTVLLTDLDQVHVVVERHVSTRPVDGAPGDAGRWHEALRGAVNGGGGADVDSDGE